MTNKLSIRFYNDREVRAIWDEEKSQWWFSVLDIVGAITESPNPRKYWSVLKTRLKKSGNELTTRCSQLKLTAADGKKYATDCFAQDDIQELAKVIPSPQKLSPSSIGLHIVIIPSMGRAAKRRTLL